MNLCYIIFHQLIVRYYHNCFKYPPGIKDSKKSTFLAVPTQRQTNQSNQPQLPPVNQYRQAAPPSQQIQHQRLHSGGIYTGGGYEHCSGSDSELSEVAVVHDQSYNPAYYNELK